MKDMEGEGRINLSILDTKPKLDLSNMDSGIVFDHDDGSSMGSLTTRAYINNSIAGDVNQNGSTVMNSFADATKLSTAPNNDAEGSSIPPETTESKGGPSTEDASAAILSNSGWGRSTWAPSKGPSACQSDSREER